MKTYLDSSAFAKRYIEETGSDRVEKLCGQATALALSVIGVPEIISALNRRVREGALTRSQYRTAKSRLSAEVADAEIVYLVPDVIMESIQILETSPVRTLDALHVACAVHWGAEVFVSSDERQLRAARKAGLKTRKV